jgi:hypothetical protein
MLEQGLGSAWLTINGRVMRKEPIWSTLLMGVGKWSTMLRITIIPNLISLTMLIQKKEVALRINVLGPKRAL